MRHAVLLLVATLAIGLPHGVKPGTARADPSNGGEANEVAGAKPQPRVGRLVKIPLPLAGDVEANRIVEQIRRLRDQLPKDGPRPVLVLEFEVRPESDDGVETEFERAMAVARFLTSGELTGVQTIAYLPHSVRGHAMLVAMACEEIYMADGAEMGDAGAQERVIDDVHRSVYRSIADQRKTIPVAVALGMLDRQLRVMRVETDTGTEFVLEGELERLRETTLVRNEEELIPRGQLGRFTAREARHNGLAKFLAHDRQAIARNLELAASDLVEDPSLGGQWNAIRVTLSGPVNAKSVQRVQQIIHHQQQQNEEVNFICLWIDSPGGSPVDAIELANYLGDLDSAEIRTVAYVPNQARGDAALIAVACDHLVLAPGAVLGGSGAHHMSANEIENVRRVIRDSLAPKKSRSWSLIAAMIDPSLEVHRYTRAGQHNLLVDYFGEEELESLADGDRWRRQEQVTSAGTLLELDGELAKQLGLATGLAGNYEEFKQLYALDGNPLEVEPGWALQLIEALAHPGLALLLLMIGFAALYAELQAPGIGVGAFIAGVCFLLYFWSQFLSGTAGWLEVLLFTAGVVCILLEIFVMPGFGVFGLGGAGLIVFSLVLASQTFIIPRNPYQLERLGDSLMVVGLAMLGFMGLAAVMRRYLPHTPLFGRVMLQPPAGEELHELSQREAILDLNFLIGQTGITTTRLAPSGVARFDNELVHVISQGDLIPRGTPVVVIEARGHRVVVRPA